MLSWGMKTSIHDKIRSLAPERQVCNRAETREWKADTEGNVWPQPALLLHLAGHTRQPACVSEILTGSWLGAGPLQGRLWAECARPAPSQVPRQASKGK